jgi:hypothetical protein
MEFELPAGQHQVSIELGKTPTRRVAFVLSWVTALLLAAAIAVGSFRRGFPFKSLGRNTPDSVH